ncbi:hypothetical protein D5086_018713 [Populus alba]|uniref:Uncharacterized protein n=1 Tax=Populus alba TaxID=43335 RepID=A0ACC4BSJ6_POPAL
MGFAIILMCLLFYSSFTTISVAQQAFKCTEGTACRSLVGYKSPNTTSISSIQKLFGVKNLHSLLGANNLPSSTLPNHTIQEQQVIKIPIPCICFNGTGASNKMPIYTVQPEDGLYYIANNVFMGLLAHKRIQQVNRIENPDMIDVGQELWIPLPCSCEEVDGERVVHYAHLVEEGSTVEEIAEKFGTTNDTLYRLNGISNNSQLIAATAFDVPLKGANNLALSTLPNFTIPAKQPIKIPFTCLCINNTGLSNKQPIYTVQKDDGLYHIAAEVFSGLVTYQEIAAVNNVTDVNLIEVGQKLWIPLPCSCDDVDGVKVVHYGHVVEAGSSLEVIAQEYGTSRNTLMKLNGIANDSSLLAGQVLDVPLQGQYVLPSCALCVNTCAGNQSFDSARQCAMALILYAVRIFDSYFPTLSLGKQGRGSNPKLLRERACNSSVRSDSVDSPFLVPNNTYFFTANNCVKCKCAAANNWTLQCEPSGIKPSNQSTCPAMQCEGGLLTIGSTTTSGCNTTTCAYAGFSGDQRIFTTLATQSTCTAAARLHSCLTNAGIELGHQEIPLAGGFATA